jgi:predicted RNA binding protein YcfA (HicA-like mRNA interferase family)
MADFYRELVTLLRKNGFQLLRTGKGNHEVWHHPADGRRVSVPRTTKSRHTANEVLKQVGLPKAF